MARSWGDEMGVWREEDTIGQVSISEGIYEPLQGLCKLKWLDQCNCIAVGWPTKAVKRYWSDLLDASVEETIIGLPSLAGHPRVLFADLYRGT